MRDRWISTRKAAKLIGVPKRTIKCWIERGSFAERGVRTRKTLTGRQRLQQDDVRVFARSHSRQVDAALDLLTRRPPSTAATGFKKPRPPSDSP